ncbi:hypothetical protein D3C77_642340 [compost metagenome]
MPVMSLGSSTWPMPVAPKAASRRWIAEALSVLEYSPALAVRRRRSRPEAGLAMIPTVGAGSGMAHLVFLFAKAGASAVPAFFRVAEMAALERPDCVQARSQGGAGETPGASAGPAWPRR